MKALVTGGAGFIGSTLSDRLLADGHEVIALDAFSTYYDVAQKRANLRDASKSGRFQLVEGDLMSTDLDALLKGVDVIFHLAGQPGVRKSWGNEFSAYTRANVDSTQRLLEAAKASTSLTRLVYASSSSVYGDAETYPTSETTLPKPISPYGVTKLAAEHLVTLYAKAFGLPTVSLRYFTVYGPRQRPDMAFHRFIKAALQGQPIQVYGDGTQIREFTYVEDIIDANILAATRAVAPGTVANLSGGSSVSVNEVIDRLDAILDTRISIDYVKRADGDVVRTGGTTQIAKDVLGWAPKVSLVDGLSAEARWVQNFVIPHTR